MPEKQNEQESNQMANEENVALLNGGAPAHTGWVLRTTGSGGWIVELEKTSTCRPPTGN